METVSVQNRRTTKGRHPLLKVGTLAYKIHLLLKGNRGQNIALTYPQIAERLMEKPQSVNGQLQRMKAEGLVFTSYAQKGNRAVTLYHVARGHETGFSRDKVEIESDIYVNKYGEYSVRSRIVGSLQTAEEDEPRLIHTARHYVAVPRPNETFLTRQVFDPRALQAPAKAKKVEHIVLEGEAVDTTDH